MRNSILIALALLYLAAACGDNDQRPGLTATGAPLAATAELPSTPPNSLVLYSSQVFKLEFRHPADWVPDLNYSNSYRDPGGREYGFVGVGALNADGMTLDQAANSEVRTKLKPYGENPRIVSLTVDGRAARLILPDEAPPASELFVAGLIVPYSLPVLIAPNPNGYEFLLVHSHKDFIQSIADTVKLLD